MSTLLWNINYTYAQDNKELKNNIDSLSFLQISDSSVKYKPWYKTTTFKTLAIPALCITYGISTRGTNGLFYSSKDAQQAITTNFKNFHTKVDDYLVFVPLASVYTLNLAGIEGKHNYLDVSLLYALSIGTSTAITSTLKTATHTLRPDSSTYNSFPSGHTASTFVAAEVMHQEFKHKSVWYSVAGYAVGVSTGALRMLNNRHWLSDVFVGAGIGILSTKLTYLYYPWVQERILKNKNKNLGIIPFYLNRGGGISLVYKMK